MDATVGVLVRQSPIYRVGVAAKDTFLSLLSLVKQDELCWLGSTPSNDSERSNLFGGLVAAQALRAGHLSVGLERQAHSAHAYFVAPGRFDEPTTSRVTIVRTGRSHAVRHIEVCQSDGPILSMLASYQVPQDGPEYQVDSPDRPAPPAEVEGMPTGSITGTDEPGPFEMIDAEPGPDQPGALDWSPVRFWARTKQPLPEDPGLHACALLAMGDMRTGSAPRAMFAPTMGHRMTSLDYSIWFRGAVVADHWMLFDVRPGGNGGSRGLAQGTVHAQNGHVASYASELKFL